MQSERGFLSFYTNVVLHSTVVNLHSVYKPELNVKTPKTTTDYVILTLSFFSQVLGMLLAFFSLSLLFCCCCFVFYYANYLTGPWTVKQSHEGNVNETKTAVLINKTREWRQVFDTHNNTTRVGFYPNVKKVLTFIEFKLILNTILAIIFWF